MIRPEYPRPNYVREEWQNLNGTWSFRFCNTDESERQIEVPFAFQSKLSGIHEDRMVDYVRYSRTFEVKKSWRDELVKLNFGAVDYQCRVYVNNRFVGEHEGGSVGFSLDITEVLTWGEETLCVEVYDPCTDETIPRGKQGWEKEPDSIWYTRTTGIWQTVWLEPVPKISFADIRFTPDIDKGQVEIAYDVACVKGADLSGTKAVFAVAFEGQELCQVIASHVNEHNKITIDVFGNKIFHGATHHSGFCWTPESPKIFTVTAVLEKGNEKLDRVDTYFGMRKIHTDNGLVFLNNRPYYQKLVLDQGYWPEGLLTAPSDEAFKKDILLSKELGFNGCRKHQKAEDPRFLYWADMLGFLVWSEIPSCPSYSTDAAIRFAREWMEMVKRDYSHPCIVAWVTINESWGVPNIAIDAKQQSHAMALYHMLHSYDETRLVISNDGWEMVKSDVCAIHCYDHGGSNEPEKQVQFAKTFTELAEILKLHPGGRKLYAGGYAYNNEPVMLTEFGGIALKKENDNDTWGYSSASDVEEFVKTYERVMQVVYQSPVLCGYCYTQLTDVEQEANGILTADREHKAPPEEIRRIHDKWHYPMIGR